MKVPGILYKFLNFRGENIRNLLVQVKGIVQEAGLPISMAARANYFSSALVEGQDWVQWSREGIMDFICPMNYNSDRNSHKEILTSQMELLSNSVPVVDGIARKWSGGENTTSQMIRQAEDSLKSGASGVSIFSLNNLDSNDFRELGAFRRANFV